MNESINSTLNLRATYPVIKRINPIEIDLGGFHTHQHIVSRGLHINKAWSDVTHLGFSVRAGSAWQPIRAVAQFFKGAAAFFAGVAGELDAIDGEHVTPYQALGIAGHQHLAQQGFDLVAQTADKLGDVGVAGLAVAAEGDELDVAHAGLFDATAGNDSLAIGQQEDLKHDPGVIGTGADFIVVELGVYGREIEFVID